MKRSKIYSFTVIIILIFFITDFSILNDHARAPQLEKSDPTGEELAKMFCSGCHLFPSPALLDKATWMNKVLPNMGWRMGIRKAGDDPFAGMDNEEARLVKSENIYPAEPVITKEYWQKIVDYYTQSAPREPLPQKGALMINDTMDQFQAEEVYIGNKISPKTSMLKFDPSTSFLFVGDANNEVYAIDNELEPMGRWKTKSAPVDIDFSTPDILKILCIGSISPSDKKEGSIDLIGSESKIAGQPYREFDPLARPVQFLNADLNGDRKEDLLICQFGNHAGKLSWFDEGDPKKEHVLKMQPGAIRAVVKDINGDGKPDIIALMAQAREELLLFLNEGKGNFEEKTIAQFPPVYGVNYFELADFNHDGHPDILMTNGDNWDLSPIRKYYHGIRILLNDGKNNFKEKLFIPFYGATKAMAYDFDGDGDLDIAAISFYDDPEKPEQTFMYLENKGNLKFTASTTKLAGKGKWLTMDIGDFDKDGDTDIFLGSFIYNMTEFSKLVSKGTEAFPQILILRNTKKRK